MEGQRPVVQLEEPQWVRVSTILADQELPLESYSGGIESSPRLPNLAEPIVVPAVAGTSMRDPDYSTVVSEPALVLPGGTSSSVSNQFVPTVRMEIIRNRYRSIGSGEGY